jgi:hypothetical protein
MLVVERILHHGVVVRTRKLCFVSAICVRTVIFCKNFLYFMRIYKSEYGVWNPYLTSAPTSRDDNILPSSNYSTSVEALYHDVRHACITSCVAKSSRGMSELLQTACKEAKLGKRNFWQHLR